MKVVNPPQYMGYTNLLNLKNEGNVSGSENSGTPKSSILIGFSIINHPFWGTFIFGNTHVGSHGVYYPAIRLHRGTCSFQVKDPVTGTLAPFNVLGESFAAAEPEWLKEGWLGFVGFYR